MLGVLGDLGSFAVAALGDDEEVTVVGRDLHAEHAIASCDVDADTVDARRVTTHGPRLGLVEADGLAGAAHHHDLHARCHAAHGDELVGIAQVDGDEAVEAHVLVRVEGRLLDHAMRGREQQVLVGREVTRVDDGRDLLVVLDGKQVDDGRALGLTAAERNLVHLLAIDLTLVGEEEHVVMRRGDEELLDEVVFLELDATHTLAAALLLAVGGNGQALDVAAARDRDDHVLVGDEVLDVEVTRLVGDLGTTLVGIAALDLEHLVADDLLDEALVTQDALVIGDLLAQLGEFGLDLLALESGQTAQAHLEDVICLDLRKPEALDETRACLGVIARRADDGDDLVDVVERDDQTLEDVGTLLGLAQLVARATLDDVDLMIDVVVQHVLEAQDVRHAVDQREVVNAKARLQLRVLVELVEDDLRLLATLEVDDDAHALAVGLVVEAGNLRDGLLLDQIGDLLDELGLVDLVGNLGHNDAVAA